MSVVAVALCLDEADVAEGWARHLADEVDHIIVSDNGSTDGTREILAGLVDELPLTVLDDPEPGYYQGRRTSALAELAAREYEADWIIPVDFDEIWYSRAGRLREVLPGLPWNVVRAPLYNHLRTALDWPVPDPFRSMVWRQPQPGGLPKVAFRWQPGSAVHQGNHGVDLPEPGLFNVLTDPPVVELRHFPIRSADHMIRKARNGAAAYTAAPDLPADWGRHWRSWGKILDQSGEDGIRAAYTAHWWYGSPIDAGLIEDPAPYRRWET